MNVKFTAAANANDGYGYITDNLIVALLKQGHNVSLYPVEIWFDKSSLHKEVQDVLFKPIKDLDFELIIMYPSHQFSGIHSNAAIMTMYEAIKCPSVWVEHLNKLGLPILAPSKFVREMFLRSGVHTDVNLLPLGVDYEKYKFLPRKYPTNRPFRFFSMGKMEPRKNMDVAVRCFVRTFKNNEDVEFIIKTREGFVPADVKALSRKDSRIKILDETISEQELISLLYDVDAFVYPSRGEGFSFPPRMAVYTGLPTLVTDWSALSEIEGAIKINISGLSPMYKCGFSYGEENTLLMADVDEDDLQHKMRKLVEDSNYYEQVSANISNIPKFNWDDTAKELISYIERGA